MKKWMKRLIVTVAIIIGLFIVAAILVPILFKDKIMSLAKKEMNEQLLAKADFKDVDLSLIKHFPKLTVSILDLSISNIAPFEGDTLIAAQRIEVSVDLMKAIGGKYDIVYIGLDNARIHALVNANGQANWNITKPSAPSTAQEPAKPFSLQVNKYEIDHTFIEYKDEQGKLWTKIENLHHEGSGDLSSDKFVLSTHTLADAISFSFGNITYLHEVKTGIDLDLNIDNKANKYEFNTEKIQLNGLKLSFKGFVQMPDTNNMVMDIQFNTPTNDFKDILSLVPGIYQADFKDIKTSGKMALNGFIKGTYNKTHMPAYHVGLMVENGMFQYPALPDKVSDIQIQLNADNADGITDHTVVNLEKAHLLFGNAPVDMRMLLKHPVSNPWTDAALKGNLDLSQLSKFVKLPEGTQIKGLINANVTAIGPIMAAGRQHYDSLNAAGSIQLSNLYYASKDLADGVSVQNMLLTFNPKNVTLSGTSGSYLKSNFTADGSINNLLAYYMHNEALNGSINVSVDKLDVNKFMGTSSTPAAKSSTPMTVFLVPANLDLSLHAKAGEIKYDELVLTAVSGSLVIKEETVAMQNISGNGLDGSLKINGTYSTKASKKNPQIAFNYDVQQVDIGKTFAAFNTVQKMMPVAKYMSGKMTTQLDMKGQLGSDMMPVINTLSGKGELLVLNGMLSNFGPTAMLADKLNLQQFRSMNFKDLKIFYSFEDGRVSVKPYQFKMGDVQCEIAGSHGFDQSMNYAANFSVPRTALGSGGNAMLNELSGKAAAKGIPVQLGDKIDIAATIGGTISNPKIETNLKRAVGNAVEDMKQQMMNEAQKKIDSAKKVVKDTVTALKNQAINEAKQQLQNQILGKKDSTGKNNTLDEAKKKAEEKAKGALKNLFK